MNSFITKSRTKIWGDRGYLRIAEKEDDAIKIIIYIGLELEVVQPCRRNLDGLGRCPTHVSAPLHLREGLPSADADRVVSLSVSPHNHSAISHSHTLTQVIISSRTTYDSHKLYDHNTIIAYWSYTNYTSLYILFMYYVILIFTTQLYNVLIMVCVVLYINHKPVKVVVLIIILIMWL